ncbi:MAG: hypothetical protein ACFFEL_14945, partial [Candidatus Thorarchaeota archaeon]
MAIIASPTWNSGMGSYWTPAVAKLTHFMRVVVGPLVIGLYPVHNHYIRVQHRRSTDPLGLTIHGHINCICINRDNLARGL